MEKNSLTNPNVSSHTLSVVVLFFLLFFFSFCPLLSISVHFCPFFPFLSVKGFVWYVCYYLHTSRNSVSVCILLGKKMFGKSIKKKKKYNNFFPWKKYRLKPSALARHMMDVTIQSKRDLFVEQHYQP